MTPLHPISEPPPTAGSGRRQSIGCKVASDVIDRKAVPWGAERNSAAPGMRRSLARRHARSWAGLLLALGLGGCVSPPPVDADIAAAMRHANAQNRLSLLR